MGVPSENIPYIAAEEVVLVDVKFLILFSNKVAIVSVPYCIPYNIPSLSRIKLSIWFPLQLSVVALPAYIPIASPVELIRLIFFTLLL